MWRTRRIGQIPNPGGRTEAEIDRSTRILRAINDRMAAERAAGK